MNTALICATPPVSSHGSIETGSIETGFIETGSIEAWVYRHPRARCIFATGFAQVCFARKLSGISAPKSGTAVWVTEDARYRSDSWGRDRAASCEKVMRVWWRFTAIGVLAAAMMLALGSNPGMAQSRAHVYLLRGLMNIFSLGMDT